VEGAPHLKNEDLPVFDCANRCGKKGQRFIDDAQRGESTPARFER